MTDVQERPMRSEIRWTDLRTLRPLELNARVMTFEMHSQLVANIKADGELDSVPLAAQRTDDDSDDWWIVSGNHRVAAAIEGGVFFGDVKFVLEPLNASEFIAKQLSHNSIEGGDDPAILAQLYQEIDDIDWRMYSGLDDKAMDLLFDAKPASIGEAGLEFQTLTFVFLPEETERVTGVFEEALAVASGADETWLARYEQHEHLLDKLSQAAASNGVKNQAVALRIVLDIVDRHIKDLQACWWNDDVEATRHNGYVPVATVFGSDQVPSAVAAKLKEALHKLNTSEDTSGQMDHYWSAWELWADQTLAS